MLRDWLRGAFGSSLIAAGLALFLAGPLFGQVATGKIQGRVTDSATGAPIAGAQVVVDGTTLGNLSNDQGFYFINEVPAGLQTVRAQFIGYRSFVIEGQRILAGQTTTLNFELEQTAVELEAITVEGERNPLVPRDQTTSKSIVQGEVIDQLPVDNVAQIVVVQPGVVEQGCTPAQQQLGDTCRSIRGGRANEEAVFIDGVITRSFGQALADNVQVPVNALEQVNVTIGSFSAEFGEAQSGVVSYVTRRGGARFTGALELQTDQVENSWRTNFNRAELSLGGPIAGPLTFFVAGTVQGQDAFQNQDQSIRFVTDGIEKCPSGAQYATLCTAGEDAIFQLPRSSTTTGATDYVDVAAPNFVAWDNARTLPFQYNQQNLFTGNLNWQLPRGSRINFGYTYNQTNGYGYGTTFGGYFNPDDINGTSNTRNVFTLGWFQTITQSADQQLALDLTASYQTDRFKTGQLDPGWWADNRDPFLGVNFGKPQFVLDDDYTILGFKAFDFDEEFVHLYRSGGIIEEDQVPYPTRTDLTQSQSPTGLARAIRANPYGLEAGYNIVGPGGNALGVTNEDRWLVRGSLDWQIGRFNRMKLGGEYASIDMLGNQVNLYSPQNAMLPEIAKPKRAAAFAQDRLDLGDLVLEFGVRWDYLDPGVEYTRQPGFVFNVPDSLQQGFVRYDAATGQIVPKYDVPCNGSAICLNNFVEGKTKSEFSPRLGASFPVTPTSTFRLSYGRFVQTPAFFTLPDFAAASNVGAQQIGFLQNTTLDLVRANQNATWARDVDMPSTRQFEFGYRQLIGQDLVIDIAAYNKKQRSMLSSRNLGFFDPITGGNQNLNVVTNADFSETNGLELKVDKAISNLFTGTLTYTFVDARGTGSDPKFSENVIQRAQSNVSQLLNQPENPPELLLRLEQSRRHNFAFTGSLLFPVDYMEGTTTGAILQDFGIFALLSVRSGLPFTKLVQAGNGQVYPPLAGSLQARVQGSFNNLETPWVTNFDLRFMKGFQLGSTWNLALFVDWRNPFNITNSNQAFAETGTTVNQAFKDNTLNVLLTDPQLHGDPVWRDFDIATESPANDYNKYMLLRAEARWGDGDGFFTMEEQLTAFEQGYLNNFGQTQFFETSNQQLRVGLRVAF